MKLKKYLLLLIIIFSLRVKGKTSVIPTHSCTTYSIVLTQYDSILSDSTGIYTDPRDGSRYQWIIKDSLIWMTENLRYKMTGGAYYYRNRKKFEKKYGVLYIYDSAQKAPPVGWRLPSFYDYGSLKQYINADCHYPCTYYNNMYNIKNGVNFGYTAQYSSGGLFNRTKFRNGYFLARNTRFWTSTILFTKYRRDSIYVNYGMTMWYKAVGMGSSQSNHAFPIRCVRDVIMKKKDSKK